MYLTMGAVLILLAVIIGRPLKAAPAPTPAAVVIIAGTQTSDGGIMVYYASCSSGDDIRGLPLALTLAKLKDQGYRIDHVDGLIYTLSH